MNINTLVPIAVAFVVIAFTLSIGSIMTETVTENGCDGTWITNTSAPTGSLGGNPVYTDSPNYGCCQTMAATGANNCSTWDTDEYAINASAQGTLSLEELASWLPTLALVIIAAIIIGVLVTYLARGSGI